MCYRNMFAEYLRTIKYTILYSTIYVTCIHVTQSCKTIRPDTKEGTLQKGQEPNPTDHRSEGPY